MKNKKLTNKDVKNFFIVSVIFLIISISINFVFVFNCEKAKEYIQLLETQVILLEKTIILNEKIYKTSIEKNQILFDIDKRKKENTEKERQIIILKNEIEKKQKLLNN